MDLNRLFKLKTGSFFTWKDNKMFNLSFQMFHTVLCTFLILFLSVRSTSSQEVSTCCVKATGSCRAVCEKVSLVEIAADAEKREESLLNIYKFCSPELIEFWECMNSTIKDIVVGSEWWGRACCSLPQARGCQRACAMAASPAALFPACRRSDELRFFECIDRQEHGKECCSNTRSVSCHAACKDVFRSRLTPSREQRARVAAECEEHSEPVLQCSRNHNKITPANNAIKYLSCCDKSSNSSCQEACSRAVRTKSTFQEIMDAMEEGGCGPPLPHAPVWQCFLRGETPQGGAGGGHAGGMDSLGVDSAKLHCCHKSKSAHCKKLCLSTFTNDWAGRWEKFDAECLKQSQESALVHCIDEVEEPCELGCEGLSYCTNFNNRPTELFRACNSHADVAAHYDVTLWQSQGYLELPGIKLPVRNTSRCSPQVWKAVACTLQVKPCSRQEHASRICREDCFSVLSHCTDWSRVQGEHNAASLCAKLSPEDPETPCISLQSFMEPSDNPYIEPYEQVSSPCKGDPCNVTQVCTINRNCPHGRSCKAYTCTSGCPLGEASQFLVPEGTYVRIPLSNSQKGCLKICRCSAKGVIDKCQQIPCFSYDSCMLANKNIEHGSVFYMECNICSCFAGEIVCSKKQCDVEYSESKSGALTYTRLPCNCPPHHVPVCGSNGNTYPSSCLAKCAGLGDADIEFGECSVKNKCSGVVCPEANMTCISNPTVCLSLMHRPCLQHICVDLTNCAKSGYSPVCDTQGQTHPSPCHMVRAGKKLDYVGKCLAKCSKVGTVCGINGNTYTSECAAWADYISVDYEGPCLAVGIITESVIDKCRLDQITCPPLVKPDCLGYTPPGACCSVCGGALKILYSRKQIDRALYALRGHSLTSLTLKSVLSGLQRQIQVAECAVRGYVTIELDIFVMVQSTEKTASDLQLEACVREAEKLSSLITRHSARIVSELSLSSLTVATPVHMQTSSDAGISRPLVNPLNLILSLCVSLLLSLHVFKVS